MISYSIDVSVYAYLFQEDNIDSDELYNYYKTLGDLYDIIIEKRQRKKRYFLFENDIKMIMKNDEINFIEQDISLLDQKLKDNGEKYFSMKDAREVFYAIFERLNSDFQYKYIQYKNNNNNTKGDLTKYYIFEKWFNIDSVVFDSEPSLPDDVMNNIKNKEIRKNARKHLAMIAILNKFVYKNDDSHYFIMNSNIALKNIQVTAKFDIKMGHYQYFDNNGKLVDCIYKIKNMPTKDTQIKEQNVKISTMKLLVDEKQHFRTWEEVYSTVTTAKNGFTEHLKFGTEIKTGITDYLKLINDHRNIFIKDSEKLEMIDKWLDEFPDALYSNLKALKDFLAVIDLNLNKTVNPVPKGYKEIYFCNRNCDFINFCSSNIHNFGADCVDETRNSKNNPLIMKDRTKKDENNNCKEYNLHLRVNSFICYSPLWFLSLRIHFRWIPPNKIEIGWIGRHLYLPCNTTKDLPDCHRYDCPLHPSSYNKKLDDLQNFIRQF